jgi:hypothetical protein
MPRPPPWPPSADRAWDERIVPALTDYIAVPAKSPMFDADWAPTATSTAWCATRAAWVEAAPAGPEARGVRLPGRTPVIFFEMPATKPGSRPTPCCCTATSTSSPSSAAGATTWAPGRRSTKTACCTAAAAPTTVMRSTPRSPPRGAAGAGPAAPALRGPDRDLRGERLARPAGLHRRAEPRLGNVSLVVCLDSGAGNYDQLWLTTSLRGMVSGVLKVEILTEGMHSGDASGLVPSSFRILRQVLDRLEDSHRPPAARELPLRDPGRASSRRRPRRPSWATRSGSAFPGPAAPTAAPPCPPPPTRSRRCSTAPGGPRSASPGSTAFPN